MIYPALWINHNFSQMFPIANFVYKANARFVLTIARSRSRNISRYFPRTIGDVLQRMLAPPRRDFEQKRSSRNLASLWISTDASLSATPPHPPTPPACSFSLFLSLPSCLSLAKFVAAALRRSWHKSERTTSRKAFSYVCRIEVGFDASGSPLTRSAGYHPHPPVPSAVHGPFCPFSHRRHCRARSSFARHVRRMNDNLRVLDSPPAGKAFSSYPFFRLSSTPIVAIHATGTDLYMKLMKYIV